MGASLDKKSSPITGPRLTRRGVLIGGLLATCFPCISSARASTVSATLNSAVDLYYAYVERTSGRIVAVKSFAAVNPAVAGRRFALYPYVEPFSDIYFGQAATIFKQDVARYGLMGAKGSTGENYTPRQFTHHLLLNLGDRELGHEIGRLAMERATEAQKATASALLRTVHSGYNGSLIIGNPQLLAEATRFFVGRELLKPVLYQGVEPKVGMLAELPARSRQLASLDQSELSAGDGAVQGAVALSETLSAQVGIALESAITGVSASAFSINNSLSLDPNSALSTALSSKSINGEAGRAAVVQNDIA